jgi:hypothetical protein
LHIEKKKKQKMARKVFLLDFEVVCKQPTAIMHKEKYLKYYYKKKLYGKIIHEAFLI